MSSYPIPATPTVVSPSPTPSESSDQPGDAYFPPTTRSAARQQRRKSPRPESIAEEEKDASNSDSSTEKRARRRSRSPILQPGSGSVPDTVLAKRRPISRLTTITKSAPLANGNATPPQQSGYLSPYARVQKSWRDFSRSPSPLGLIPLHRHYRTLIHKHEIPRKLLHVSIGFLTLRFYTTGIQTTAITPWLLGALIPIASTDVLRHRWDACNKLYVKVCGALMRETEVDGYNGVIWYLLGAYISLKFYPKDVGVMSVLLLSWCDTAASTFGRLYGRYTIRLRRGKSLAGTLAAFVTGVLAALFFWGWLAPRVGTFADDPEGGFMFQNRLGLPSQVRNAFGMSATKAEISGSAAILVMSICTGLIASFSEFVDLWGWDDNLTIPLLSSASIWAFLKAFG